MTEEKKPIQVKLTEEQRRLLDAAAAKRGMSTSTWMRSVALEAAKDTQMPAALREALKAALEAEEG